MRFFTGGYPADMGGEATGIGMLHAGSADTAFVDGALGFGGEVVSTDSPSWLAAHPTRDVIYAALEKAGAPRVGTPEVWAHLVVHRPEAAARALLAARRAAGGGHPVFYRLSLTG